MNSFGQVVSLMVTAVFLFMAPLLYYAQKEEAALQAYLYTESADFIDTIRNSGVITKNIYETYMKKIYMLPAVFEVELIHEHSVMNPFFDITEEEQDIQISEKLSLTTRNFYLEDIKQTLYEKEESYYLRRGDRILLRLTSHSKLPAEILLRAVWQGAVYPSGIRITYGGAVRDEDY